MPPPADFASFWPDEIPLRAKVRNVLQAEYGAPEGRVRATWVLRLVQEYGFDTERLDINVPAGAGREAERDVVFADIVAYRDKARREPFIVVETKRPRRRASSRRSLTPVT